MNLVLVQNLRLSLWPHASSSVVFRVDGGRAPGACLASEGELQWPGLNLRADDVCDSRYQL